MPERRFEDRIIQMTRTPEELLALDKAAMDSVVDSFDWDSQSAKLKANRWAHRAVGVILAGGQATRLDGQDKAFITVKDRNLVDRCASRLAPQVSNIVVSANGDLARFGSKYPVISDDIADFAGPLAGILAAMRWTERKVPGALWLISVAVDTPFFPQDLADRFVMAMGGPQPSVVLAQSGEQVHPTFGLWPIDLADDLQRYLESGDRKVQLWAEQHNCSRAIFSGTLIDDLEIDPFFNINNPDDIDVAHAIADGLSELGKD